MRDIAILFIILPLLSLAQSATFVRDGEDQEDEVQESRNHLLIQEEDEIGIGMGRSIVSGRGAAIGNQEEAAGSPKPPLPILLQAAGAAGQHLVST